MDPRKRPSVAESVDSARLRPHLRERARLERAQAETFREQYAEAVDQGRDVKVPLRNELTKPGDPRKLRGIPAIARGVGGAIPGTNPAAAIEAKSERRAA